MNDKAIKAWMFNEVFTESSESNYLLYPSHNNFLSKRWIAKKVKLEHCSHAPSCAMSKRLTKVTVSAINIADFLQLEHWPFNIRKFQWSEHCQSSPW